MQLRTKLGLKKRATVNTTWQAIREGETAVTVDGYCCWKRKRVSVTSRRNNQHWTHYCTEAVKTTPRELPINNPSSGSKWGEQQLQEQSINLSLISADPPSHRHPPLKGKLFPISPGSKKQPQYSGSYQFTRTGTLAFNSRHISLPRATREDRFSNTKIRASTSQVLGWLDEKPYMSLREPLSKLWKALIAV